MVDLTVKPFTPLVKRDFFTPEELENVWHELHVLSDPNVLAREDDTGPARTTDGLILKRNRGVFLSDFYIDINYSPVFRHARKIFEGITAEFSELGFAESAVLSTVKSNMLLQYYEDSDHYKPHKDYATTTVLYWFCKEPQSFEGGDLIFRQIDEKIKFANNTMVMFPSWAEHEVTPVKMTAEGDRLGRFSVTQFLLLN